MLLVGACASAQARRPGKLATGSKQLSKQSRYLQGTNSARLPLSLPPDPVEELSEPGQHFENWNPQLMQTTVWAFETFLQVGATQQKTVQLAAEAPLCAHHAHAHLTRSRRACKGGE